MAKISFPVAAIELAPNTGDATKTAPLLRSFFSTALDVFGCTVEVSTKILSWTLSKPNAASARAFKTSSFEI